MCIIPGKFPHFSKISNLKFKILNLNFKPLTQIRIWISKFEFKLACNDENAISWGGRWGTRVWTPLQL